MRRVIFHIFAGTFFRLTFYAPRMPADPFARSAVSSQRSLLAAQFSRSAVSIIPSKPGRAQGWDPGPGTPKKGPPGPPRVAQGPRGPGGPSGPLGGKGAFGALGAHWGHWDNSEAIPNGIVLRFHLAGWRQARMDGLVPIFLAMDQAAQSIKSQ